MSKATDSLSVLFSLYGPKAIRGKKVLIIPRSTYVKRKTDTYPEHPIIVEIVTAEACDCGCEEIDVKYSLPDKEEYSVVLTIKWCNSRDICLEHELDPSKESHYIQKILEG